MCGIFAIFNSIHGNKQIRNLDQVNAEFAKGRGRGPEHSTLVNVGIQILFGFHRLAINGLNETSNQPLIHNNMAVICNGEIYNFRELYSMMGVTPTTGSDCEVILHLYERYGIEHTLQMLDGVFAFVLYDYRDIHEDGFRVFVARDPYGVRPLYTLTCGKMMGVSPLSTCGKMAGVSPLSTCGKMACANPSSTCGKMACANPSSTCGKMMGVSPDNFHPLQETPNTPLVYAFASEAKMLANFRDEETPSTLTQFPPGYYSEYILSHKVLSTWKHVHTSQYHSTGFNSNMLMSPRPMDEHPSIMANIQSYLTLAVFKRCNSTERPIACLLSGGLDSSLIAALVQEYHRINELPPIETYSIGLEGSEDLKFARIVADHIGSKHTEVILTEDDFIAAVPDVIRAIESYDTTTVRASLGNWLLGKYIAEHSEAKVIFNGDGSDELCGGYLYMGMAPDPIEFDKECRRLLRYIHSFDVLRSDKSISSHGLEPRTPFLDRSWVQYYLSILPQMRFHPGQREMEKWLLREAFSSDYFTTSNGQLLLPHQVLWRRKEAFSDGVTGQARSLYQILGDHAKTLDLADIETDHNPPTTAEQVWYRTVFEEAYPGLGTLVPYFWMPKYVDATDASARTLAVYTKTGRV